MTPVEASAVWRRVFRDMGQWEADDGRGSARPEFERAWRNALQGVPLAAPPTTTDRETCWRKWLESGETLTRDRLAALLRDAAPGMARYLAPVALAAAAAPISRLDAFREPGEEG